jgi:hypothetical protein
MPSLPAMPAGLPAQPFARQALPANALADEKKAEKRALDAMKADAAGALGGGAGGLGAPAAGTEGLDGLMPRQAADSSKLFPRASLPGDAPVQAGPAQGAGEPGMEPPMGGAGAGARNNQEKDKKRAGYLDSVEHLEEAIGDVPIAVRPILDR